MAINAKILIYGTCDSCEKWFKLTTVIELPDDTTISVAERRYATCPQCLKHVAMVTVQNYT